MTPLCETRLCELARKYRTDKGGGHLTYGAHTTEICHNYTPFYYSLFKGQEDTVKRVLEIGVNAGCSQRMWEEFYPNAEIIGLDIDRNYLFNEGRVHCFYADQNNPESLRDALAEAGPGLFDLIVDDGSHNRDHQTASLPVLLPHLADHGYYVVEDLECEPEYIGRVVPPGFRWKAVPTTGGLGRAKDRTEMLVVVIHG
jgi:hypothetical protein